MYARKKANVAIFFGAFIRMRLSDWPYCPGSLEAFAIVPFGRDLLRLDGAENPDAPVFRSRTGKPLDRARVLRIVQEAAQRAGISGGVSSHWLRHARATHSLERGAPIHLMQATSGHASVATKPTVIYTRVPNQSSAEFIVAR